MRCILIIFSSGAGSFSPSSLECCLSGSLVVRPVWQILWVLAVISLSPRVAEFGSLLLFLVVSVLSAAALCPFIP